MYNLRYNIASLVAVFLALGVGLLLGTIVAERGVLDTQKNTLVSGLNKEFESLRTENRTLQAGNVALTSLATEAAPRLAANVLVGRTIVIVADADSSEAVAHASDAIRMAGGFPAVAIFGSAGLSLDDARARSAAMGALGLTDASQVTTRVIDALAHEWTTPGDPRRLTDALVSAGALRLAALPGTATVSGGVDAAVYDNKPDPAALSLAKAVSGAARLGAGIEITKRPTGMASAARAAGLSAVDDMDSPLGQLSLVWVLAGRTNGWYGALTGADAAYPTPLFPAQ
jgi:hypothetical protein